MHKRQSPASRDGMLETVFFVYSESKQPTAGLEYTYTDAADDMLLKLF